MAKYGYSLNEKPDVPLAKALGVDMGISTKDSIEICDAIRKKPVARAKKMLEGAMTQDAPIRYNRFSEGASHKPGIGMGRYPVKAATAILKILSSAEANAQVKGLGKNLVIIHARAQHGTRSMKFGRHSRRISKRTHIEIALGEAKPKKEKKEAPKKSIEQKVQTETKK
ncbi:MAG: 50S ribosomal protein L22 [Candidatus Woesearchaeota archaeon]